MAGGSRSTVGLRSRVVAKGRPNWWVILAVSLALMALLVAIAGGGTHRPQGSQALTATSGPAGRGPAGHRSDPRPRDAPTAPAPTPPSTSTSTTVPSVPTTGGPVTAGSTSGAVTTSHLAHSGTSSSQPATTTPAPAPAPVLTTTTTTAAAPSVAQPADRGQWQGYLDPPVQTSTGFGFTGTGAMSVSVVWSGSTYLTMSVTCATGSWNVGGSSAMAASLPDAGGSCQATVSEPASESTALTFSISIGPAGA